jgi:collagenase-like PrtC family protease
MRASYEVLRSPYMQACRMPYGLVVNGSLRELGDIQYLLSPQDLMAVEHLPQLIQARTNFFKSDISISCTQVYAMLQKVIFVM